MCISHCRIAEWHYLIDAACSMRFQDFSIIPVIVAEPADVARTSLTAQVAFPQPVEETMVARSHAGLGGTPE